MGLIYAQNVSTIPGPIVNITGGPLSSLQEKENLPFDLDL